MRILFIQPPIEDFYDTQERRFPLGLFYIANYIHQQIPDLTIRILDARSGYGKKTLAIPTAFHHMKPYYLPNQTLISSFHTYNRFGASWDELYSEIALFKPDIVGISSICSTYFKEVVVVASQVKHHFPEIITVLGGGHPSLSPESILTEHPFDFFIRGEGEIPFAKLLDALLHLNVQSATDLSQYDQNVEVWENIPGLCYRRNHEWVISDPYHWETIQLKPPFESFGLDLHLYRLGKQPMAMIQAGRGCRYRCAFCCIPKLYGNVYRLRPVPDIIEEMVWHRKQGVQCFDFEDDHLNHHHEWFMELLKAIRVTFGDKAIQWVAMNGIPYQDFMGSKDFYDSDSIVDANNSSDVNSTSLDPMIKAGFQSLNLSLVTTSSFAAKQQKRYLNLERFTSLIQQTEKTSLKVTGYLIIGLPNQGVEEALDTLFYLFHQPILIAVSPFYHLPGLDQTDSSEAAKYPLDWYRLTAMKGENHPEYLKQVHTLFLLARILNYIKKIMVKNHWKSFPPVLFMEWLIHQVTELNQVASFDGVHTISTWQSKQAYSRDDLTLLVLYAFFKFKKIITMVKDSKQANPKDLHDNGEEWMVYRSQEYPTDANLIERFIDLLMSKSTVQ